MVSDLHLITKDNIKMNLQCDRGCSQCKTCDFHYLTPLVPLARSGCWKYLEVGAELVACGRLKSGVIPELGCIKSFPLLVVHPETVCSFSTAGSPI